VRAKYAEAALAADGVEPGWCCGSGSGCGSSACCDTSAEALFGGDL
jgi:hypothetical protein